MKRANPGVYVSEGIYPATNLDYHKHVKGGGMLDTATLTPTHRLLA